MITNIYRQQYDANILMVEYDSGDIEAHPPTVQNEEIQKWLRENEITGIYPPIDYQEKLREERNIRLEKSDWTQLPDVTLTAEQLIAWTTYRQTLRDFPDTVTVTTAEELALVDWPLPPGE